MQVMVVPDPGLGNTSYVVDLGDGSALEVDPERDPRPYLEVADRLGLVIRHVAETHLHADFVSGARELVALGASLLAPRDSRLAHPHLPVDDGDEIVVGDLTLRVLATPGHTPEHVAYLLVEGSTPRVVFSGGTLMAGGVARPDLISSDLTVPLAHHAYRSVRHLLAILPGDVELRPTHGGGSFCSSAPSRPGAAVSTVAEERRTHPAQVATDADEFVDGLLAGLGSHPTYFSRLRPFNRQGPEVLGPDLPPLAPVAGDDVGDAVVVDVRLIDRFAAGHLPGSVSIELRDQFGTWLGWLFEPDTPIVFVLDPDQDERDLVRQALNVGHQAIVGRVDPAEWTAGGRELATVDLVGSDGIRPGATVVDVRQRSEWDGGHVDGAVHVELGDLVSRSVDEGAVLHCGHGQRAMTAASLLRRRGVDAVSVTRAGPAAIAAALTHP
jgi:glyoxylase-like metal-dependent hydrolase (beta-lactamase superfamily II)/rhodanese-related sulfurtransferase